MSRRDNADSRCHTCAMHKALCICDQMPVLHVSSRLCLVIHHNEKRKTTNTGQLAARCLPGSEVIVHGRQGQATNAPWGEEGSDQVPRTLLLYPSDEAQVLSKEHVVDGPVRLVVPDGNWRQAAKMARRIPWMTQLQQVTLAPGSQTSYRLRHEPKEGGLATMEAIARAFGILEGPTVQEALEDIFRKLVDRTLYSRGQLARDQVYGGIPEGVERHIPCDLR